MRNLTIALVGGLLAASPSAAAASTGGGLYRSPAAHIALVVCRTDCVDARTAQPGSYLRVYGRRMGRVRTVTFLGGRGNADDVVARVAEATPRSVVVRVPEGAQSGRLRTRNADGSPSRPSTATIEIANLDDDEDAPPVADRDTSDRIDGYVETGTAYFGAARRATLRYVVTGTTPLEVGVTLVRIADGAVIRRWTPGVIAPGVQQTVTWDGTGADGKPVREGRYEFRVFPIEAAAPLVADSFRFLAHKFPVRGTYRFGSNAGLFGAARGGRSHQGQDVFAACGTPVVAARGGTVVWKAYQSRAGHYVVISGDGTDVDYVYMHLRAPATVKKGERVATGQVIGAVGDTGVADGCHLHFEMWSGPGWYEGGSPFDPLPSLKAWAAQSATRTAARTTATRR
jgi:hypothetical protein